MRSLSRNRPRAEVRYSFVNCGVVKFATKIQPAQEALGLKELLVLKKAISKELTLESLGRSYMLDLNAFVRLDSPLYVQGLLLDQAAPQAGLFGVLIVSKPKQRYAKLLRAHLSFKEDTLAVSVLATQLLADQYPDDFHISTVVRSNELST